MKPLEVLLLPADIYGKDGKKLLTARFGLSALPDVIELEVLLTESGSYSELDTIAQVITKVQP